jgi:adenylate cyclase
MGDAIMAFWNAPLDDTDHAAHALGSALDMMRRMDGLNEEWAREAAAAGREHSRVNIGIGINSGDCCVGNLGSSQRFDYSAIGDDVNVASRYEGLSKVYGVPIVVGEPTVKRIAGLNAVELDLMRVKGRAHPTRIYTPAAAIELDPERFSELDKKHMQFLHLYRKAEWDAAEAAIVDCETFGLTGLNKLYHLYRERIQEWRKNPPPSDWDGAFTATSK